MISFSTSIINACNQSDLLELQLQETLNKKMKSQELVIHMVESVPVSCHSTIR